MEPVIDSAAEWGSLGRGVSARWVLAHLRHRQAAAVFEATRSLASSDPRRPPSEDVVALRREVWKMDKEAGAARAELESFLRDAADDEADRAEADARAKVGAKISSDVGLRDEVTLRAKKVKWLLDNWRELNPSAPESERPPPMSDARALRQARDEVLDIEGAKARQLAEDRFERLQSEIDELAEALGNLAQRAVGLANARFAARLAKAQASSKRA